MPGSLGHEGAITAYLSRDFPDAVPAIVAAQPERRWFLMKALPGSKLEDIGDMSPWERAAAAYGRLQVDCVARRRDLVALGCPTRPLDALAPAIDSPIHDEGALRGLSSADLDRLRACAPELRRRCERLAACGIPSTIEHGDLWPGNFILDGTACAIIDWEDVAIGHPFLSLAPLICGLDIFQPRLASAEARRRIERAYLAVFADLAPPERLDEALHLAAPLSFVDMAIRYRSQRTSMVRLHPWMRELVPDALRFALERLDADAP